VNDTDCTLGALPALTLNFPDTVSASLPAVSGSSEVASYTQNSQVSTGESTYQVPNTAQVSTYQ